jgi:predicted dehydrogenase
MRQSKRISRRKFLQKITGAAAGVISFPYIISSSALGTDRWVPASEKITLGFIGTGMQGRFLLSLFLVQPDCQVVALCDVDRQKLDKAMDMVRDNYAPEAAGCVGYRDFKELLARRDIDAVVIATPEHWHAIMAIEACKKDKDVYCEKPLALTIAEARQMVDAARRYGRVFQTGSMQRSDFKFRRACELVRNGYIGQVKDVRVGIATASFPTYPVACWLPGEPTPGYLDWDKWLGPAQWRPYNSRIAPPIDAPGWPHWRDYEEFAGGIMTDWGAHHFDIVQWALGMDDSGPVEVYPEDGKDYKMLTYRYSSGATVVRDDTMRYKSIVFSGTQGEIEVSREFLNTKPESLLRQRLGPNEIRLYQSDNHYADWLDCIRSRRRPICDVEIGCRSLTVCHLGIIAHRLGRPLKWDPVGEKFVGDEKANRMLSRPIRSPWHL